MRRGRPLLWLLLALGGCSAEVDATNPFDPATPVAQQAKASLVGEVSVGAGFGASRLLGGVVRLLHGETVAGRVELTESGRFRFEEVAAGAYGLRVEVPGFGPRSLPVSLRFGQALTLPTIELEPLLEASTSVPVKGRVELAGATAHGGVRVEVLDTPWGSLTDPEGGYGLTLPTGRYALRFSRGGYDAQVVEDLEVTLGTPLQVDPVRLLGRPGLVHGQVRLDGVNDPEALAQVRLRLRPYEGEGPTHDARALEGVWRMEGVGEGEWALEVALEGFTPVRRRVVLGPGEEVEEHVVLSPTPPEAFGALAGTVRLGGAGALAHRGVRVAIRGRELATETGPDGRFHLAAPAGTYTLELSHPGYGAAELGDLRVRTGETTEVPEAVLEADPGRLFGEVRLGAEGDFEPARLLEVELSLLPLSDPEAPPRVQAPLADGRFAFEGLPPGAYGLVARLAGFGDTTRAIDVAPGARVDLGPLPLIAEASRRIIGRALRHCAAPPCHHGGVRVEALGSPFVTTTGSEGDFTLEVSVGEHRLRFSAPDHAPTERLVVVPEAEAEVALEAPVQLSVPPSSLRGAVFIRRLDALEPASGASVEVRGAGLAVAVGEAGPEGTFQVPLEVVGGPYTAHFELARHAPQARPFHLVAGAPSDLGRVVLEPVEGRLLGSARRVEGVGPVTVVALGDAGDAHVAGVRAVQVLGAPGEGLDLRLPAGPYEVLAVADGHRPAQRSVQVPAEGEAAFEAALIRRHHRMVAPALVSQPLVRVRFEADEDLRFGRARRSDRAEPAYAPIPAEGLEVELGEDGDYLLYAQVANQAHVRQGEALIRYQSPRLEAWVRLDTRAPEGVEVLVAAGQEVVHAQVVPVTFGGPDRPDHFALWTEAFEPADSLAPSCAQDPVCGGEAFSPFRAATTLGLPAPEGPKKVCWKVCDAACNCAPVDASTLVLGPYQRRPTPELDAELPLEPPGLPLGAADARITLHGRGIAADTEARIGNQALPCVSLGAEACRADDDGGCGAVCEATCAERCVVDLGGQPLLQAGGTWPVHLYTPTPVTNGVNGSRLAAWLNIVSPVPRIARVEPPGILVADLSEPELRALREGQSVEAIGAQPRYPLRAVLEVDVCNAADNADFHLGGQGARFEAAAQVVEGAGVCLDQPTRRFALSFDTAGLVELPEEERVLRVRNPSPGGQATLPFGMLPGTGACVAEGVCPTDLGRARPASPDGWGRDTLVRVAPGGTLTGARWFGGSALSVRAPWDFEGDAAQRSGARSRPRMLARTLPETSGGLAPVPLAANWAWSPQDDLARHPRVALAPVTRRSDGRFGALEQPEALRIGARPTALALEDVDEDGFLDVLVASCGTDAISLRLNDGRGGFLPGVELGVGACPTHLDVLDVNGDGHADVLAIDSVDGGFEALLGHGDGTFGRAAHYGGAYPWAGLEVADLDRDGFPDVLSAAPAESLAVLVYGGRQRFESGWLTRGGLAGSRASIVTGYFDGGRALDAAFLTDTYERHFDLGRHLDGQRSGGNRSIARIDEPVIDALLADLDTDGRVDLAVVDEAGLFVVEGHHADGPVMPNDPARVAFDAEATGLQIQDLDGDALPDALLGFEDGSVGWLKGDGALGFGPLQPIEVGSNGPVFARVADLDGDGTLDLLALLEDEARVVLRRGVGREAFAPGRADYPTRPGGVAAVVTDYDHDAEPDVVSLHLDPPALLLHRGLGGGRLGRPEGDLLPLSIEGRSLLATDVNGDGATDLVVADAGRWIEVLLGDGEGAFQSQGPYDLGACAEDVFERCPPPREALQSADLDGDGRPELIAGTCAGGLAVLGDYGPGGFGRLDAYGADRCTSSLALGRVESRPLLLSPGSPEHPGRVTLWWTEGAGLEPVDVEAGQGIAVERVVAADVDGDGVAEVVALGPGRRAVWRSGGQPWTREGLADPARWRLREARSGWIGAQVLDANGDGHADLAQVRGGGAALQLRLGRALGDAFDARGALSLATRPGSAAVAVGDLDRNGVPDLLTVNDRDASLSVWRLPAAQPWTLHLRDAQQRDYVIPPSGVLRVEVDQAAQWVEAVHERVYFEGEGLEAIGRLWLRAPDGRAFLLRSDNTQATVHHHQKALQLTGPQPAGAWTFLLEGPPGTELKAASFTVITRGAFLRRSAGFDRRLPAPLQFAPGASARRYEGTTVGGAAAVDLSCADTALGPERWHQLDLPKGGGFQVHLEAAHGAVLEIRRGRCDEVGPVGACGDAALEPLQLAAGPWCLLVDGLDAPRAQAGRYALTVVAEAPLEPSCADCPVVDPDPELDAPPSARRAGSPAPPRSTCAD